MESLEAAVGLRRDVRMGFLLGLAILVAIVMSAGPDATGISLLYRM